MKTSGNTPAKGKKAGNSGKVSRVADATKAPAKKPAKAKEKEVSEPAKPKKPFGGPQEGSGRPRIVVDLGLVEKLAQIHASQEEIAATLGVSVGFVSERMKNDEAFAAAHARGWSNGKLNLRRKQLEKAMAGDATMQIWLGKNMLGQADKAEVKTHQTFSFVVDLS